MTARIKRTNSPGESASEASGSSPAYGSGPQNFLDNARISARTATYPNSAAETAHVAAVDAEAFDRVQITAVRVGDVVMEGPGHPARIERITRIVRARFRVWVKYIWQPAWDVAWPLGDFDATHPLDRALPGEYTTT